MTEKGYMIVADITGYTQFLSHSELEHAQEILTSLINSMLDNIQSPLILARVEGDAIFAYTKSDSILQGQTLLESMEHIYFQFLQTLESNIVNTTCTCNACATMDGLNLKIVIHHGEFGLQKLAMQTDLVGSDVNITHRLLKNTIIKSTGIEAYAFFTKSAITAMRLEKLTNQMVAHVETYEHIGNIDGYVYDLAPAWQRERERRRIYVDPNEADFSIEFEMPIPPMVAWDYLNEPENRARYRNSDTNEFTPSEDGKVDVGSVYHCAHGKFVNLEMITDWKPFDYVTIESRSEILNIATTFQFTVYLEAIEYGTHVSIHYLKPSADNKLQNMIINGLWKAGLKKSFEHGIMSLPSDIKTMLKEETESGRLSMRMIAAGGNP